MFVVNDETELEALVKATNFEAFAVVGGGKVLYDNAASWFNSKVKTHSRNPAELTNQIEKNYVYFAEATGNSIGYCGRYLCNGMPVVPKNKLKAFVTQVGRNEPLISAHGVTEFLHGYSQLQFDHRAKVDWRQVRLEKERLEADDYFITTAHQAVVFHMATVLADVHLERYFGDTLFRRSCRNMVNGVVLDTLYREIVESAQALHDFYLPYASNTKSGLKRLS
jgi:hypothetical protein